MVCVCVSVCGVGAFLHTDVSCFFETRPNRIIADVAVGCEADRPFDSGDLSVEVKPVTGRPVSAAALQALGSCQAREPENTSAAEQEVFKVGARLIAAINHELGYTHTVRTHT